MAETGVSLAPSVRKPGDELTTPAPLESVQPLSFEQKYYHNCQGEAKRLEQDGTQTQIACYELVIDMKDNEQRAEAVTQFMLSAAQAGYTEAMGPLVFPPGEKDGVFGSLFFTLEKPQPKPPITQSASVP